MSSSVLLQATPLHVHILVTRFFTELGTLLVLYGTLLHPISLQLYITHVLVCEEKTRINNPDVTKDSSLIVDKIIQANSIRVRDLGEAISTTNYELHSAKVGTSMNHSTNHPLQ